MTQSTLAATTIDDKPNDNISVPYGLIRTIRHYLEFVGLLSYIRGLKSKGLRLDLIVVAMYVHHVRIQFIELMCKLAGRCPDDLDGRCH